MATNDNWGSCPACGGPVMLDPVTGIREACSQCVSKKSKVSGWLGIWFVILFFLGTGAILYFSIRTLFP